MFSVGEMVIYGAMGVCRVESICEMDIPGAAREYYLLIPEYVPHSKVYAPVDNNPVEMRGLLSRRQAELLIESFPAIKAFPIKKERAEQYEMYRNVLKSADSTALAKLIKTLHERKRNVAENKKTVPIAEKEFFEKAEMILYGEIASVLEMPFQGVWEHISDKIENGHAAAQPG